MKVLILEKNSIVKKVLLALLFLGISLVLPQILHFVPIGNLGKILLPINFSIILAGMLLEASSGLFLGITSPLFSYLFFNMPNKILLPVLMIECIFLGIISGYLKDKISNKFLTVILTLVLGIIMSFLVIFIGQNYFPNLKPSILINMLKNGIPGMILQVLLIPALVDKINKIIK